MGRKSQATIRNAKIPKHITKIAMTPEQYYELKVYIKSIILPGTPAYEYERLSNKESKQIHHQWLNSVLEVMGPKFFQEGSKGLVWPVDYHNIYKVVHQVVRAMSIGIRKNHQKELRATRGEARDNETKMTREDHHHEVKGGDETDDTDDTDVKEGMALNEDEKYAQWEQEEKMMAMMMAIDQENQEGGVIEEGMDVEPIELEDLLGLMKPEVFAHFPNLENEYFDWDEIIDPSSPEPIARLLLLLS